MDYRHLCPLKYNQISTITITKTSHGRRWKHFMKNPTREKLRKRMRLPNGFGRITKIKGRLRKPYRAMVTVGKDEYGKPIGKLLKPQAYFETYNEAYAALLEYNRDPFDVSRVVTLEEIYKKWYEKKCETVGIKSIQRYDTSWKYCHVIKDMNIREIRVSHLRKCLDEGYIVKNGQLVHPTEDFKKYIKLFLNMVFDYAVEYGYIERNVARDLKLITHTKPIKSHMIFTNDEMEILWANKNDVIIKAVLLQCYSGMRPGEILKLETKNIDLVNNTIVGGIKTEAGTNRIIPIHPLVKDMVEEVVAEMPMSYTNLRKRWLRRCKRYGINEDHKLHDGRKHFITLAKKYNVDEYALKRIVGHKITDITESVYTERDPSWLYDEICKIQQY